MSNLAYIFILAAIIYFTQGIGSLTSQPLFYYLKETLHLKVGTIMLLGSLTSLPWMIKPLYGFLSDNFPILGYKRKSYIIVSCILSLISCLVLGTVAYFPLVLLFTVMILDSLGGAIKDVAIDGYMVEEGKKHGLTGQIQSVQWGALTFATVLTGIGGGYIAEHFNYQMAYLCVAIFPLLILLVCLFLKEDKSAPTHDYGMWNKYFQALKNKQFVLSGLFLFCLWFSPSLGTPILAKMRDELHMSKLWIGTLSTIGSACSILGALLYYRLCKHIDLKKWLYWGTLLSAISTFAYLYLTSASVLWYNIVFGVSGMFVHLIMMDFMARTCPEGTEATTFALLCSLVNFGTFCSNSVGGKLYDSFGYNGLVIISGVTTLLCLAFIPYLKINHVSTK